MKNKLNTKKGLKFSSADFFLGFMILLLIFVLVRNIEFNPFQKPDFVDNIVLMNVNDSIDWDSVNNKTIDLINLDVFNNNSFMVNCDILFKLDNENNSNSFNLKNSFLVYPQQSTETEFKFNMPGGDSDLKIYPECIKI